MPKSCLALAILIAIEVSFILLTSLEHGLKFGVKKVRSKKKNDAPVQKYEWYLCDRIYLKVRGQKWVGLYNKRAVSANLVRIYRSYMQCSLGDNKT
ncbi:MAG: hypothetical protein KAT65_25310 [Methanophagales archaeon]|nr:hypothetical protein [Methanophagales archaeon]